MGYQDRHSFTAKISSATTDTQIFTGPWRADRRYIIKKLILTNENVAANTVKFYDKDAASGTPTVRGDNANAPLLEFIVPAASTMVIKETELPCEYFQSGMVGYASVTNCVVMVEIQED